MWDAGIGTLYLMNRIMVGAQMTNQKEFSTSTLAREMNKNPQDLFQQLADMGFIVKKEKNWELTDVGRSKGGAYKDHEKYGRYIVWPESIIKELDGNEEEAAQPHLLTSTIIGKQFDLSPVRTNSLLSELGLIEKGVKGWQVTEFGKKFGGVQTYAKKSGIPYVCWPESIKNNKMFLASINDLKGESSAEITTQGKTSTSEDVEFRDKFKPTLRATDGHYVRSKAELLIDNWLYVSELVHAYERKLPVEEEIYSDFYIPKGKVYIEYWGYDDDNKYTARKQKKLEIYKKYNFRLIEITDKEVQNLDDTMPRLLLKFGIVTE
jgi:hypothetical protein